MKVYAIILEYKSDNTGVLHSYYNDIIDSIEAVGDLITDSFYVQYQNKNSIDISDLNYDYYINKFQSIIDLDYLVIWIAEITAKTAEKYFVEVLKERDINKLKKSIVK